MANAQAAAIKPRNGRHLKAVKSIPQQWLADLLSLQLEKQALARRVAENKAILEEKSDILCAYFKLGIRPEKGPLTGQIAIQKGRRQVTKDIIINTYGEPAYQELLAKYIPVDKEYFDVTKRID